MENIRKIKIFSFLGFVFFALLSCSSKKISLKSQPCHENLAFKKAFFDNVKNVEDFMTQNFENLEDIDNYMTDERIKSFKKALRFISNYSHVSFESMANYARKYPYGVFLDDKTIWLKWYEENKCGNIQFKNG